jgi:hypothetical protein
VRALRCGILSLIGTLVYAAAVSSIGYGLGSAWDRVAGDLSIAGYLIAALLVAAITAFIIFRLRALRCESAEDPRLAPGRRRRPGNGIDSMWPWRNSALVAPAWAALSRARFSISSVMSRP